MLGRLLDAAVYVDAPLVEIRREEMERRDREEEDGGGRDEDGEFREIIQELTGAFKTIQLLGQALKNSPGTIVRGDKSRAIDAVEAAGLRTLGWVFGLIRDNADAVVESLVDTIRKEHPGIPADEVLGVANDSLRGIALLAAHGMIRRIVVALAAPELMPLAKERSARDGATPAAEMVAAGMYLESLDAFPVQEVTSLCRRLKNAKNWLGVDVLCLLVLNHFQMFHVRFDVKQSMCEKLGIEYKGLQGGGAAKLLPSGREPQA
jgi:hypothetical protein